jgi:hypothetical protein
MAPTPLTDRALVVLAHLLTDPHGDHTAIAVACAIDMPYQQVHSAFGLLLAHGWVIRRHAAGPERPIALTSVGRVEGAALVAVGDVGVPLAQVDRDDPVLADKVRAMLGWPLRHAH